MIRANLNYAIAAPLLIVALTGCATASRAFTAPTPAPPANTGIAGLVTLGPNCPVMREDEPCPDTPYQATIEVLDANGTLVTTVQSDAAGRFQVGLAAGSYTLRPLSPPDSPFPYAAEQTVIVVAGQITQVTILYDTGIR